MLTLVLTKCFVVCDGVFIPQTVACCSLFVLFLLEGNTNMFNCCYVCWLVALAFELRHSANNASLLKITERICIEQLCYSLAKLPDRQIVQAS